jgi:hypothetical protein
MLGLFKKKQPPLPPLPATTPAFPPVPSWRPSVEQPLQAVIDRLAYYTNGKQDFAVFRHGTCVLLPQNNMPEVEAGSSAKNILDEIYHDHPDMNPLTMDDGNILATYNYPAVNVVLNDFAVLHWDEIERNYQGALATSEVLVTPLGPNTFDNFGKKALFGRCFMFMDAQDPDVIRVERATV